MEVGAGVGNLTSYLAQTAKRVIAVELDKKIIPLLSGQLAEFENVEIVQTDILDLDPDRYFSHPNYLVVANIPYYITSALIRHLLEADRKPARMILTIQKEVAQRICASPGKMSLLALSVQVYGNPRIVCGIPARAFYPAPKVASAVVRVDLYPHPLIPSAQLLTFFRLTKAAFKQKRKTLHNSLAAGLAWPKEKAESLLTAAGIDPQRRPQTLSIEEWRGLVRDFEE